MLIIMDNPNLDDPKQEYYNRLFEEYSKTTYKMNPEKCKWLGSIICTKNKEKTNENNG